MSDLADISKVVSEMQRDLHRLGECRKLLVSRDLSVALHALLRERAMDMANPERVLMGTMYFRGTLVVECDSLQDLEYAFVK